MVASAQNWSDGGMVAFSLGDYGKAKRLAQQIKDALVEGEEHRSQCLSVLADVPPEDRWAKWRPSVAACQHEDLLIDRFELLHESRHRELAELVATDISNVSPETTVILHELEFKDPWDFEEVFAALHAFARGYKFDTDKFEYLIHITTGSHVQQICEFLLAESRHFPARLLQTSPPPRTSTDPG